MDTNSLTGLLHTILSPAIWEKGLAVFGGLCFLNSAVPKLLTWGVPAATALADRLAAAALNSPLRPVILWQAPKIILFLDALTEALITLLDTFRDELKADLEKAQKPPEPPTTTTEPTPTPEDKP